MEPVHGSEFAQKKVPIRRPRKACTICRGLKTRCLPDGEDKDPKSRCSRCARLNLVCEYSRARRGRKNSDNEPSSPPSGSSFNGSHLHTLSTDAGAVSGGQHAKWDLVPPYDPVISGIPDRGLSWNQHRNTLFSMSNEGPSPPEPYAASNGSADMNPSPFTTYSLLPSRTVSFLDYLEPPLSMLDGPPISHDRTAPGRAAGSTSEAFRGLYNDPIEVGYITEHDARHLFNQFMLRVAPSSTLFDPHYHTFERVRASPILLTAILYAAGLFFRPEIAGSLRSLAENYMARKMHSGDYDLTLVQAILVLVYWKHPNDRTTYQTIGVAARLSAELRLQPFTHSVGAPLAATTEEEERKRADIERTVQNVHGLDVAISFAFQLPPALTSNISSPEEVLAWAQSHRHLDVPGDFLSAFSAGLWEAHSTFGGHPRMLMEGTPLKYTVAGYTVLSRRLDEHLARFQNHPMLQQEPYAGLCQLMGKSAVLKVRTIGWLQNLSASTTASTIVGLCEDFLEVVKRLAATGDILFCSDMTISVISLPGILLHLGRQNLNQDERRRSISFMRQIADIARTLSGSPGSEHTMAFIERFYRRLGQDFDRGLDGDVAPGVPLQPFTQYQWPGPNPAFSTSVGNALGQSHDSIGRPADWAWSNMLDTIPTWDGGIVP